MNGWIKLHRQLLTWEWYDEPNTLRLFLHLLLKANIEPKEWRGTMIQPGQVLTGRQKLSEELKLSERKIRTSINRLKSTNEIAIKTTSKYSIITICKWEDYQQSNEPERPAERPAKRTTNDQQTTTTKEYKNKEEYYKSIFDQFRREYPGTKRGLNVEWADFRKKNKPEVTEMLLPGLKREINYKESLRRKKSFVPEWKNLSTWLNKQCWTQEFKEIINAPTNGNGQTKSYVPVINEKAL